jgi:hypothetical protein
VQDQAAYNRVLSACQSAASGNGVGFSNVSNNCVKNNYGDHNAIVASINAKYEALCKSIDGC